MSGSVTEAQRAADVLAAPAPGRISLGQQAKKCTSAFWFWPALVSVASFVLVTAVNPPIAQSRDPQRPHTVPSRNWARVLVIVAIAAVLALVGPWIWVKLAGRN
jgi:hypothetical protein